MSREEAETAGEIKSAAGEASTPPPVLRPRKPPRQKNRVLAVMLAVIPLAVLVAVVTIVVMLHFADTHLVAGR